MHHNWPHRTARWRCRTVTTCSTLDASHTLVSPTPSGTPTPRGDPCGLVRNRCSTSHHWPYVRTRNKVIQSYVHVKITASFRYHSLLVLKYAPDQLPCQIRTTCKCYLVCTWKTQASAAANGLVYWGLTPQQQPGSYQGGKMMMMMKSDLWWRKPEYPEETTNLRQVTDETFHTYSVSPVRGLNLGRSGVKQSES